MLTNQNNKQKNDLREWVGQVLYMLDYPTEEWKDSKAFGQNEDKALIWANRLNQSDENLDHCYRVRYKIYKDPVQNTSFRVTNKTELEDLIFSLGSYKWEPCTGSNLVKMAGYTALDLWLNQTPETLQSQELRRQLKHLNKHGHWDFTKEKDC